MSTIDCDTLADLRTKADEVARDRIADDVWERAKEAPGGWPRERAAAEAFEDLYGDAFEQALEELIQQELEAA